MDVALYKCYVSLLSLLLCAHAGEREREEDREFYTCICTYSVQIFSQTTEPMSEKKRKSFLYASIIMNYTELF